MSVEYAELVETVLPYTVGDGKPEYRTNPVSGQRYSFQELKTMVQETSKSYDFSFVGQFLTEEQRKYDVQG